MKKSRYKYLSLSFYSPLLDTFLLYFPSKMFPGALEGIVISFFFYPTKIDKAVGDFSRSQKRRREKQSAGVLSHWVVYPPQWTFCLPFCLPAHGMQRREKSQYCNFLCNVGDIFILSFAVGFQGDKSRKTARQ